MNDTKKSTSLKVNELMTGSRQDLQPLLAKVQILNSLNQKILPLLESNLRPYCQIANIAGNRLILLVANGSVATQLRFLTPNLLDKFKQDPSLKKFQEIQIKVRPSHISPKQVKTNSMTLLTQKNWIRDS